jgi:hypothetical protein
LACAVFVKEKKRGKMNCKKCDLILFKHEDGWDCYKKADCYKINGKWIPRWFDDFIIEDAASKQEASNKIKALHVLGICLVTE